MQCWPSEVKAMGTDLLSAKWGRQEKMASAPPSSFRMVFSAYGLTVWITFVCLFVFNLRFSQKFSEEQCLWEMLREQSPVWHEKTGGHHSIPYPLLQAYTSLS